MCHHAPLLTLDFNSSNLNQRSHIRVQLRELGSVRGNKEAGLSQFLTGSEKAGISALH